MWLVERRAKYILRLCTFHALRFTLHGLILLALLDPSYLHGQSVYLPLNHWAYNFVERLEAKGLVTGALNGTKPYTREELAGYLLQVEERVESGSTLSKVEADQLAFLRFELKEELEELGGTNGHSYVSSLQRIKSSKVAGKLLPGFVYKNNRNLFTVQESGFRLFIDPIFFQQWQYANPDSISRTDRVFERTHGLTLWGRLGSHVGFYVDVRDTKEWGNRAYPSVFNISREGLGFVNGYGTHIWHDETVAYVVFKLPYMQLTLGKDANYWGSGFNGALSLSNHATSYDQIKLQTRVWRLKFTYLLGFLRSFPSLLNGVGETRTRSIAAHRLEIDVAKWLDVAIYETVVFGDRRFELAYLNPINFYRSAEHFLGDRDNATMGLDVELMLIPNVKLYGELFVDDLFTSRLGSGWYGNKTAFLAGGLWADAFKIPNLDARFEYAKTRPFVYTHLNEVNSYQHFSTGLGHWIGPNSDDLYMRLQYRLSKQFFIAIDFESFRHGANEAARNVGGDINQPRKYEDDAYFDFLEGIRERSNRVGLQVSYELLRNLYLGLNLSKESSRNIVLPDGGRGPLRRSQVSFSLSLNR